MKSVYIHGSYFGNNYGDVLLVDLFAQRVRGYGYEPVFPFANNLYKEQTGVKVGRVQADNVAAGIFCGGGYFGEPGSNKLKWSFRNYLRHNKAYKLMNSNKIDYGVFGAGFGPISFNPFKGSACNIMKGASDVVVRDDKSKQFIELYTSRKDVDVAADVVISLKLSDIPQKYVDLVSAKYKSILSKPHVVGIHVTDMFDDDSTFKHIKGAIARISNENPDIYFLFLSDGTSRLGKKLKQTVDAENIANSLDDDKFSYYTYENHWEMTYLLSRLDLVITSKLHVGIVSTAMNVSVISIPYHQKTIRYYEQVEARERCLEHINSEMDVYNHIRKFIFSDAISVPKSVLDSSENVFKRMESFLNNQGD